MISPHPDYAPCSFCGRSLCVGPLQTWDAVNYYNADIVIEVKVLKKKFTQVWSDDKKRVVQALTGTEIIRLCPACLHVFTKDCHSGTNPNYPL